MSTKSQETNRRDTKVTSPEKGRPARDLLNGFLFGTGMCLIIALIVTIVVMAVEFPSGPETASSPEITALPPQPDLQQALDESPAPEQVLSEPAEDVDGSPGEETVAAEYEETPSPVSSRLAGLPVVAGHSASSAGGPDLEQDELLSQVIVSAIDNVIEKNAVPEPDDSTPQSQVKISAIEESTEESVEPAQDRSAPVARVMISPADTVPEGNDAAAPEDVPGRFPEASTRLLTEADLALREPAELKIMRNEVYARRGYIFYSPVIKDYFARQPWYTPRHVEVDALFSEIERANIRLIKEAEKKRTAF